MLVMTEERLPIPKERFGKALARKKIIRLKGVDNPARANAPGIPPSPISSPERAAQQSYPLPVSVRLTP